MYSSLIHKHSCVFKVKHNKNLLLLASYFRPYLIFEKNIWTVGSPHNISV